jgi:phospholipid/cholesterol/gamma-HCH transport system permease protein
MKGSGGWFEVAQHGDALVLQASGHWLVETAAALDRALKGLDQVAAGARLRIDLAEVESLDTVGAWLVLRTYHELAGRGVSVKIENVPPAFAPLFDQVAKRGPSEPTVSPTWRLADAFVETLEKVGRATMAVASVATDLLGFLGAISITAGRILRHPMRFRATSMVAQMQRTGVTALPIVGLLSFLIGVVLAFQGADQLRRFGAEIYTVNLLGIGVLRELGVLMTAIIVAGRSGSAITAEIGTMQVNEEVDALRTLGLDPMEVLVLPRMLGLTLVLPLLTFYADVMAILGGALMSWAELGVSLPLFARQLHDAVYGWTLWLGILKAPFFAVTIALVGCHAGLRVSRSAESVGHFTTVSVVQSIFLVIIIDAAFSILFARLHI